MGFSALLHVYFPFTLLHVYLTVYLTVAHTANWSICVSELAAMLAIRWAFTPSSSARLLTLRDRGNTGRCKPHRCQAQRSVQK
uniref:Putative secreted protein n=1 Tax=Ixodes ricinus TaxID=34613 RepID=A0A6B0TXA7_IXORI